VLVLVVYKVTTGV